MARPAWATKSGRMTEAEHREIDRLALALKDPKPSKIARRLNRHPATITWYMLRAGLLERTPKRRHGSYRRCGKIVVFFSEAEDRRLLELRRAEKSCGEIATIVNREFASDRGAHSVHTRLVLLGAGEDIAA